MFELTRPKKIKLCIFIISSFILLPLFAYTQNERDMCTSNCGQFNDAIPYFFLWLIIMIGLIIKPKDIFGKLHTVYNTFGLSATSISEITKVPRTTVLRKIANLEKIGILKKDEYKRYTSDDLSKNESSKKILSIMDHNIKLLGIFFSQCLETYSIKN